MAEAAGLFSLVTPFMGDSSCRNLQKLAPKGSRSKWHRMIKCSSPDAANWAANRAANRVTNAGESVSSVSKPAPASQELVVKRRAAMVASMAAIGFGACSCCCKAAMAVDEEWSYGGPSGPPLWSGTCATGQKQSPIDVPLKQAQRGEALGELVFDYQLSSPVFTNSGHGTMEVQFPEGVNKLRLNGRELNLVQFHFHTPSEHAFDGLRFPMEAHLVHRDAVTKATAVVGIMLDATPKAKSNDALAAALQYSPLRHGKPALSVPKNLQVTAADLLPPTATKNDIRRYVQYSGSLTTPTCDESVDWFLLEKPLIVSTHEVLEFLEFVGEDKTLALNARPIQPLKGRPIFVGP